MGAGVRLRTGPRPRATQMACPTVLGMVLTARQEVEAKDRDDSGQCQAEGIRVLGGLRSSWDSEGVADRAQRGIDA